MFFLQLNENTLPSTNVVVLGTLGMFIMATTLVSVVVLHQRRVIRFNNQIQKMEEERQQMLLRASIRFQEEERQRIAADLHDDAGPLLATARLYLNENLIHQEEEVQLQSIFSVKQIIDDTIKLIRNISHSLMPPTLKNFGLEAAIKDLFEKINGSGVINASARFHDNRERLNDEKELLVFRIIQELVTNIIKHSHAGFIHLTQNAQGNLVYFRIHHDGKGILQADYDKLEHDSVGLGLKNIQSRIRVLKGKISFDIDTTRTYYKVTIEVPREPIK
ncbi:MAG: histidine kinase [Bacteroidota bacterium]|nr:histidine kinase [Bacteroidota bacterium]